MKKYPEFIKTFPGLGSLAKAPLKKVLSVWQGLGYNRRALYLKRTAEQVVREFKGTVPSRVRELSTLPGVGVNTAGAICAFAFNKPVVFIETNIRSVFIHHFFNNNKAVRDAEILPFVERTLDREHPREWYYALMDYGTMLKKSYGNPNKTSAHHRVQSAFDGSDRQVRGRLLRLLLSRGTVAIGELRRASGVGQARFSAILGALKKEKFIIVKGRSVRIAQ